MRAFYAWQSASACPRWDSDTDAQLRNTRRKSSDAASPASSSSVYTVEPTVSVLPVLSVLQMEESAGVADAHAVDDCIVLLAVRDQRLWWGRPREREEGRGRGSVERK